MRIGLCLTEYLLRQTAVNKCNCPNDTEHTLIKDTRPSEHRVLLYLSKSHFCQNIRQLGQVCQYSLLLDSQVGGVETMFGVGEATPTAKVGQFYLSLSLSHWSCQVLLPE